MAAAAHLAPITGYAAYAPLGAEAALRPHLAPGTHCVPADGSVPVPPGVEDSAAACCTRRRSCSRGAMLPPAC